MCSHEWKILSETVTDSKLEHTLKQFNENSVSESVEIPVQMCCAARIHIQVFTCIHCGEFKRFVENI